MLKFTSKEIHFLRTESEDRPLKAPDLYFSDLLHRPTIPLEGFAGRLSAIEIPGEAFICAVVRVDAQAPEEAREKAGDIFEACFHSVLDKDRGIWERLDKTAFALVFWDYTEEKNATRLLTLLKEKISQALGARILMGIARYPLPGFSKSDILGNALKAIDHAAFFGPDHMLFFDAVSLNISGDRLYQLQKYDDAIQEYEKGLALDKKNINLINSLGVCYAVSGELDMARTCFEKALAVHPKEVMVIYNIGLIHRINDNEDKAILYLRKAHGINPDLFEVELVLGHLLFKQNKFDQALPHLEAACRLNPESGLAFRMTGEIFLSREELSRAGAMFNTAVKQSPSDAAALCGYARAMALQNRNLNIALTFAKKSVALEPDNPEFSRHLEEIQEIWEQAQAKKQDPTIKSA